MVTSDSSADEYSCRFNRPAAILHQTVKYEHDLKRFVNQDPQAAELYFAKLEELSEAGVPVSQNKELGGRSEGGPVFRAPIGNRALRKVEKRWEFVPWCGGLVIEGGDLGRGIAQMDWRSYFFDLRRCGYPHKEIDDVLLASIEGKKRTGWVKMGARPQLKQQDRHIIEAMQKAFEWCRKVDPRFELRRTSNL